MRRYHAIEMRFIRQNQESRHDDLLRILKVGENSVRVIYSERSADGVVSDTSILTYQQLFVYLHRLFWMLEIDEDPFQCVQMFLPGYPTILLRVATLNQNIPRVLEALMSVCLLWPLSTRPIEGLYHPSPAAAAASAATTAATASVATASAATGVAESESESDYSDGTE